MVNKIKADDFIQYEGNEPEKYTYFQELDARVEILQNVVDELVSILRENNIHRIEKKEAEYFDLDKVYDLLNG